MSVITLEGNIGAGKTTLATALYEELKQRKIKVVHIAEPLQPWRNLCGTNLLDLLYDDISRWAFTFQTNALIDMTEYDNMAIKLALDGYTVLKERSSFSVREIFSVHLSDHMTRAEAGILRKLNKAIKDPRDVSFSNGGDDNNKTKTNPPDVTLYVRAEPEECFKRAMQRGRSEEGSGKLSLEYLKKLHDRHESVVHCFHGETVVVDNTHRTTFGDIASIRVGDKDLISTLFDAISKSKNKLCL